MAPVISTLFTEVYCWTLKILSNSRNGTPGYFDCSYSFSHINAVTAVLDEGAVVFVFLNLKIDPDFEI